MRPILTVAAFTLLEHSRRRLIFFFTIVSAIVTAIGIYLALSDDQAGRAFFGSPTFIAQFLSQSFFGLFSVVAAIAVSMSNFNQPFSSGQVLSVLARPISRWHYAIGRTLASVGLVIGLCVLFAAELQIIQIAAKSAKPGLLWAQWGISAFNLSVIVALASFFSVFLNAGILVVVITFLLQAATRPLELAHTAIQGGELKGLFAWLLEFLYYVTPKSIEPPIDRNLLPPGAAEQLPSADSMGMVIWAVAYFLGLIALTIFLVNRKEV